MQAQIPAVTSVQSRVADGDIPQNFCDTLASVLKAVQDQVSYRPKENNSREEFLNFTDSLGGIPYLTPVKNECYLKTIRIKDTTKFVQELASVFSACEMDLANFKCSIQNLATNILNFEKINDRKRVFFGQLTVTMETSDISLALWHTSLDMTRDDDCKIGWTSQKMIVLHTLYRLNSKQMEEDKEMLGHLDRITMEEWVKGMADGKEGKIQPCEEFVSVIDSPEVAGKFLK